MAPPDAAAAEEIALELEAVRYTYPELRDAPPAGPDRRGGGGAAAAASSPPQAARGADGAAAAPAAVEIDLAPRGARQAFVSARLRLDFENSAYPEAPPGIQILEPRGLGDARLAAAYDKLRSEAADLAGGPAVGRLVELAEEILSDYNTPEGEFCASQCFHVAYLAAAAAVA